MGKPTGFMEYERRVSKDVSPKQRIKNFREFHEHLTMEEQQIQGHGVWTAGCRSVRRG